MPTDDPIAAEKEAALARSSAFALGGRTFLLPPADAEDYAALNDACREMVRREMLSPLESLNAQLYELEAKAARKEGQPIHPALLKMMAAEAVTLGAADRGRGKAEPTQDQIVAKANSRDGVAYFVWHRLHKLDGKVTPEWVAEYVTDGAWKAVRARLAEADLLGKSGPNPGANSGSA